MYAYLLRRILATIPVMLVVALFVFALLHLSPGDPAAVIAGDAASPADIARIRHSLGLDNPLHVQLGIWLWHVVHGDLGTSIHSGVPVLTLIGQRLEPTLALSATTMGLAVLLAVPLGIVAAWKVGTWIDRLVMVVAILGFSLPVFWLGFLFMYGFAIQLQLLPVQGYSSITQGFLPFARHIILPSLTLGMVYMALITRMTRASMLEVLREDYIRTAHAKGLKPRVVLLLHGLKNAALPIITIIGVGVALLIGGVAVTESVFAIPGLGRLTVDAILHRDYPVIQGIILVFSGVYVGINVLVDMAYTCLDPRIRY
jgi:peptide/nickel transport system permease protein